MESPNFTLPLPTSYAGHDLEPTLACEGLLLLNSSEYYLGVSLGGPTQKRKHAKMDPKPNLLQPPADTWSTDL